MLNALIHALEPGAPAADGPLRGWTIAVKDNMDVAGTVRTDGLAPPHPAPASRDAVVVARLRAAGAVIAGKANLEALSFGATTQNRHWGACRNPWDPTRIPGGSSGGSAVAVAAGLVRAALGTDTGGSVRNPAALCGITGLRPSHGLIPMDGVTALAPSFDTVGPMARSAVDVRALFAALVGRAPAARADAAGAGGDARAGREAEAHDEAAAGGDVAPANVLAGLAVGVPSTYFFDELDAPVAAACDAVLDVLRSAGARLVPVSLPGAEDAAAALTALLNAEGARNVEIDDRVDQHVRDRFELGRATTDAELAAAWATAGHWGATVAAAFQRADLLITPAAPCVAPRIGEAHAVTVGRRLNRCHAPFSLALTPALVLPAASQGLPAGVQLVGAPGADATVLDAGVALQQRTDWHERRP